MLGCSGFNGELGLGGFPVVFLQGRGVSSRVGRGGGVFPEVSLRVKGVSSRGGGSY